MKEIDKKIKTYYKSKSLSKDQLERIIGQQTQVQRKPWKSILKYAAIFALLISCFFLYKHSAFNQKKILEKYAKEVAFNHLKNLESDIRSQSINELNQKMAKLNFEIEFPELINSQYALLGGRYCSIDERIAAQLKLKNKDTNSVVTLYVLDKLKSDNYNESFLINSTSIQIWNSNSNLFVLASDSPK